MQLDTGVYNDYIASLFAPSDSDLTQTLAEMERENVRSMNVSTVEGKLLQLLARTVGAKRILEVGTLGGYSGIHLVRALPEDGMLITLELDPHHAAVARRNFDRAGIRHQVEIRVGPASETLEEMIASGQPPFDLIFIDATRTVIRNIFVNRSRCRAKAGCCSRTTRCGVLWTPRKIVERSVTMRQSRRTLN